MASETLITLFDVPTTERGNPLSLNVWKIRYALNFKGLRYKTTWIECPEIEPTMRRIGAAPTATRSDGSSRYTVPVIVDHSRLTPKGGPTVVSDSWRIAEYLDEVYPSPALLFPEGTKALQNLFSEHFYTTAMFPSLPLLLPEICRRLNEESRPFHRAICEASFGRKLDDVCPKGSSEWDEVLLNAQKGLASIAKLLDENGSGACDFIMGKQATFVDFVVAAFLETYISARPEEWHEGVRIWDDGRWEKMRDLSAQWRIVY